MLLDSFGLLYLVEALLCPGFEACESTMLFLNNDIRI